MRKNLTQEKNRKTTINSDVTFGSSAPTGDELTSIIGMGIVSETSDESNLEEMTESREISKETKDFTTTAFGWLTGSFLVVATIMSAAFTVFLLIVTINYCEYGYSFTTDGFSIAALVAAGFATYKLLEKAFNTINTYSINDFLKPASSVVLMLVIGLAATSYIADLTYPMTGSIVKSIQKESPYNAKCAEWREKTSSYERAYSSRCRITD